MMSRTNRRPRLALVALLLVLVAGVTFAQHDWGEIVKSSQYVPMENGGGFGYGDVAEGFVSFALDVGYTGPLTLEVVVTEIRPGAQYEDDDSALFLFDAEGHLIAENDDSPFGGSASLINGVDIQYPGRYYAIVTTFPNRPETDYNDNFVSLGEEGGSNISFELLIEYGIREGDDGYYDEPLYGGGETAIWFDDFRRLATRIHYTGGELVVPGNVGAGVTLYNLTLEEAVSISAEVLVTGDMSQYGSADSVLYLFDSEGYYITEDDDSGLDAGSLIHDVYLDFMGGYYLAVVTFPNFPNMSGDGYVEGFPEVGESAIEYQLIIGPPRAYDGYGDDDYGDDYSGDAEPYPDDGIGANAIEEIAYFSQYVPITNGRGIGAGEVGVGYSAFELVIDEPLYVTIEVVVTEVRQGVSYADSDSMLSLFGADGLYYASDDDGGVDGASKIESVYLPQPGTYYAIVSTYPNAAMSDGGYFAYILPYGESNIAFDLVVRTDTAAQ